VLIFVPAWLYAAENRSNAVLALELKMFDNVR